MIKSQTIDAVINQVTNSPSSIFTKEDILKLIEGMNYGIEREKEILVEEEVEAVIKAAGSQALALTEDQVRGLTEAIEQEIETSIQRIDTDDIVDFDTATFGIEYNNTLRLDDIEVNTDRIVDQVLRNIEKQIIGYLDYITLPVKTVVVEE